MAAQQHPPIPGMTPALTVLQLDTTFPRIPGDIGCVGTYRAAPEIVKIPGAAVARIVTSDPARIDIAPFVQAAQAAQGQLITTSCGFLSYWQSTIADALDRHFISSALMALPTLDLSPNELLICTFDPDKLNAAHLPDPRFASSIVGLAPGTHLRQVIEGDLAHLDPDRAQLELIATLRPHITDRTRHILLECTNMPPYKRAIAQAFGLPVSDILDLIEAAQPGTIHPDFLSAT
ncbi:hypothetical protein C8N43_3429 [Litoreibacter ponti]|uniref:Aspartate/glutamate racemase n=1 Tax=Litoreibacter ponti TaxID=1510457 RepID=A0A2T6BEW4_9RHOB|nr:hypothetical protein [Litoreibacter ponti]PTX54612.1 hypothetical protein C8N43_3429 [Litoreibacter ponti]